MPSYVWNHFDKRENKVAMCRKCKQLIKYQNGTQGMIGHLKKVHGITNDSHSNLETSKEQPSTRQSLIVEYQKKPTLEEEVSKLACSGLSFNQIATVSFIRSSLMTKFPDRIVPKDSFSIGKMIQKFSDLKKGETRAMINSLKSEEKKFSATLDEWTSSSNFRFLNINLHYAETQTITKHFNLGMIEMDATCPAEKLVEMVRTYFYMRSFCSLSCF